MVSIRDCAIRDCVLIPSSKYERGATEQINDDAISQSLTHRVQYREYLMVLDDKTRCWFDTLEVSI